MKNFGNGESWGNKGLRCGSMGKVLGSIGEGVVPRLWHKCFRPVARLFLTDDITVLSIRKGSYQCLLGSIRMHGNVINNAC